MSKTFLPFLDSKPERILCAPALSLMLGLLAAGIAEANPPALLEDERNTIAVFENVSPSVAFITNKQLRRDWSWNLFEVPAGTGSGFVWDTDGHIVTNYHVVDGGNSYTVKLDGDTSYEASLVGVAPDKDLAVLKINAPAKDLVPVLPGDSGALVVGQKVLAIGNPFGLDHTLTTGIVSALGREMRAASGRPIEDVIQTDASINPGNSGGPLLDSSGRLIGISTAIMSTSGSSAGVGFAVPVNTVNRIVPELIEFGRVKRAGLGVVFLPDDWSRRWKIEGLIVRHVQQGSAAGEAGIREMEVDRGGDIRSFDVITAIDDAKITNLDAYYKAIGNREIGDRVTVRVVRGEETIELMVKLQEIP